MRSIIRHAFPDLTWLKAEVARRLITQQGWPTVILHVQSLGCYRPDVKGPLSLFMNIKGQSACKTDNRTQLIPDSCYFISNQDQPYTLTIEPNQPAETFNIHFGQHFINEVYAGLVKSTDQLLDKPAADANCLAFYNKLYPKDAALQVLLRQLYRSSQEGADNLQVEELLAQTLMYLLQVHQDVNRQVTKLPAVKYATRQEVYKRLALSVDYMHSFLAHELSLEVLAGIACLSKFHYLRLFRACYRQSPYQYLTELRLQKAKQLLQNRQLPVNEVALGVGFANLSSFSRAFCKKEKISATVFRAAAQNSNFGKTATATAAYL